MSKVSNIVGPDCTKCRKPMAWHSVELVAGNTINVFHCSDCDKFAAAAVKTSPALVSGSNSSDQAQR